MSSSISVSGGQGITVNIVDAPPIVTEQMAASIEARVTAEAKALAAAESETNAGNSANAAAESAGESTASKEVAETKASESIAAAGVATTKAAEAEASKDAVEQAATVVAQNKSDVIDLRDETEILKNAAQQSEQNVSGALGRIEAQEHTSFVALTGKIIDHQDDGFVYYPQLIVMREGQGLQHINPSHADMVGDANVVTVDGVKYFRLPRQAGYINQHHYIDIAKWNESPKGNPLLSTSSATVPAGTENFVHLGDYLSGWYQSRYTFDIITGGELKVSHVNTTAIDDLQKPIYLAFGSPIVDDQDANYVYYPYALAMRYGESLSIIDPNHGDYSGDANIVTYNGAKHFRLARGTTGVSEHHYFDLSKWDLTPKQNPFRTTSGATIHGYSSQHAHLADSYYNRYQCGYEWERVVGGVTVSAVANRAAIDKLSDSVAAIKSGNSKILLPSKIYIVEGRGLPIYGNSILRERGNGLTYDLAIESKSAAGIPRTKYLRKDLELDSSWLGSSARVHLQDRTKPDQQHYLDVEVVNSPATTTATPSLSMIGDSLTNRHIALRVKALLNAAGGTTTTVGTIVSGGEPGEGREGWEVANYIGRDTDRSAQLIAKSSDNPSSLFKNPFLKLATTADKVAHPTWCFHSTRSNIETSWADDPTGDVYIFDYAYYLSEQGFAAPDLITIALSRNDVWNKAPAESAANIELGLEIMVTQIRAAAPSAKIAIIHETASSNTAGNADWEEYSDILLQKIAGYSGREAEDIYMLNVGAHLCADFNFPLAATTPDTQTGQITGTRTEYVHWGEHGKYQYAEVVFAWAMAMI